MVLRDIVNIFSTKCCPSERRPVEPGFMVLRDNVNIFSAKHCASQLNLAVVSINRPTSSNSFTQI